MTIPPKKPRKTRVVSRKDFNQVAFAVGQIATGDAIVPSPLGFKGRTKEVKVKPTPKKMTAEELSAHGRKASRARWDKA